MPRLQAELRVVFHDLPVVDFCENVASMRLSDAVVMSEAQARHPICCCASGMSRVARPRLYWPSFPIAEGEEVKVIPGELVDLVELSSDPSSRRISG